MLRATITFLAAAWAMSSIAQIHDPRAIEANPQTAASAIAPTLKGLGEHHMAVTTDNEQSQYFFDQGVRLTYGFNHSEALRAFKEAARLDPDNAMAYWGWALVLGPNLNLPMQPEVAPQAYQAISQAMALREVVSARERALIEALATRYVAQAPADRSALDQAYADAMADVVAAYPDDPDAATLYAASLMNLQPWDYWYGDGTPKGNAGLLVGVLESVIERNPNHPGALHYHIHAVEEKHPQRAVASADALLPLMPGAGHMVHMPSHIYMRVGRYQESYAVNAAASQADADYIVQCRAQGIYPLNYYPHNMHFKVWSAMFLGQSQQALADAGEIYRQIPPNVSGDGMGLFESFLSQPMYVMVRFGMWDKILETDKPSDDAEFMLGVWHYGRALAYQHIGERRAARRELAALRRIAGSLDDAYLVGFGAAPTLLEIGAEVVEGEMAAARGKYGQATSHLEKATRLQDSLRYSEPPDWYFPVRHVLGAVLLEAGEPAEAAAVYWQDLSDNPGNGYALFGLQQALTAMGDEAGADNAGQRFDEVWANADHALTSSRF